MNPLIKQSWLTALRSGEYPQSSGTLRNTAGYCCLGVLCDVIDHGKWTKVHERWHYNNQELYAFDLDGVPGAPDQRKLGNMNDVGYSFTQIADYIEEHL